MFSCGENKEDSEETNNGIIDCSSTCDCADKLVVIVEDIREIEKRLWENNLTKDEERDIELKVQELRTDMMMNPLLKIIEDIPEKERVPLHHCESIKNMKGNIAVPGIDDKDGNSTLYYYDGYVKEDSSGNKTYFLHDGTLITRIEK
jgi:hypothetical protein